MRAVRGLDGAGTPETAWRRWPALGRLKSLTIPDVAAAVIVAPHPDDEVLGCAGLLRHLHARGVAIHVIAVTDGEASHPDSPTTTPGALAQRRVAESIDAYERLGLDGIRRTALHVPDGSVGANGDRLTRALHGVLGPGTLCVAPWDGDGHPDHDAVGRLAESRRPAGEAQRGGGLRLPGPIPQ